MGVTAGSGYAGELMSGVLKRWDWWPVTGSYLMAYVRRACGKGGGSRYSFIGTGIGTMLYAQAGHIGWLFCVQRDLLH